MNENYPCRGFAMLGDEIVYLIDEINIVLLRTKERFKYDFHKVKPDLKDVELYSGYTWDSSRRNETIFLTTRPSNDFSMFHTTRIYGINSQSLENQGLYSLLNDEYPTFEEAKELGAGQNKVPFDRDFAVKRNEIEFKRKKVAIIRGDGVFVNNLRGSVLVSKMLEELGVENVS